MQRADQFLCYDSRSALLLDILEIQRADHFLCYVSRSPCHSRQVRNTEGGPIFMLRFEVRSVIRQVRNQRADHFLCYVLRSALSLDILEIQRADHSSCCVLRSAQKEFLEPRMADHSLYFVLRFMRFKTYVRISEGGPILILGLRFTRNSYFGTS